MKARTLGLTSATGLVIGSIVGTGVFTMPAVLAGAGTMGIIVLGVIAVGAMLLAVLFGQLTKRVPNSDGGLYAYSRHEFGDFAGYLVGWCYWIQAWAGNAAIVASWVFYVDALFGISNPTGMENWGIALIGLWIPALVNLAGVRQMAWFQNVTVVLKFLPLLFVGVVGWFFVHKANFGPFNASGGSLYSAIGIAAGVALFSFIGVEAAAMTAKRVANPRKNVMRASVIGTAVSAILYVLVTAAVMGLVAHHTLVGTGSPFVNAFQSIFPNNAWAGKFIAALAVISGIGALNGWTLIVTETSRAIAQDDLFPRPFAWTDRNGTAWFGILVGTALPSLLMLWRYTSSSGLTVFTYLVDLTVVTVAIPYFFSAIAQLTYPRLPPPSRAGLGAGTRPHRRRRERPVLDVGDLRLRLPGRLPGPGRAPRRAGALRVLERPPPASRRGGRTGGPSAEQPAVAPPRRRDRPCQRRPARERGSPMTFSVDSEVGQLRKAIIHRPGLELSRLTPDNIGALLFDDIVWASKAKTSTTHSPRPCVTRAWRSTTTASCSPRRSELPEGREFVLDRLCTPEILGPSLVDPIRRLFEDLDGQALAEYLVGGVLKADLHPQGAHSLKWDMLRADDFLLTPLPNHLFQRDNSCWIYGGVTINPMAKPARQRESLHTRAIYRSTRCSPPPSSPPTTAATTTPTSRPRSRAGTST